MGIETSYSTVSDYSLIRCLCLSYIQKFKNEQRETKTKRLIQIYFQSKTKIISSILCLLAFGLIICAFAFWSCVYGAPAGFGFEEVAA